MNITENKSSESVIEFIIELDRADIENDLQKAAKHLAEHLSISGFRPGKAPYDVVCRQAGGEAKIYEEAIDGIIRRTLPPIIIEKKLETTGRPDISIQKMAPPFGLTYKAVVSLLPQVELGDVSKIKVKTKPVKVEPGEIDKLIDELRRMRVSEAAVERPIQKGDKTVVDFEIKKGGTVDEFAKGLGGYDNAAALRQQIEDNIRAEKEAAEKERLEMACMEEFLKISKISALPEPMIAEETEKMLHELEHSVAERGGKFDDYLQSIKKTKDELLKDFRPGAEHRLRLSLVARAFGKQENIAIDDSEVDKEIELAKKAYQANPELVKQFSSPDYHEYARAVLTSRKIFETLAGKVKKS